MPGAIILDHLQPVELFSIWICSWFSTFILGSQFLLPQRAKNGKVEFSKLQKWMRQRGSCAWEIQTGPFEAPLAHFVLDVFQYFNFHAGEANSYYPNRPIMGNDEMRGFSTWGIQPEQFAVISAPFVLEIFILLHFHTGRSILITPAPLSGQ